jgi:hypothetical protein
MKSHGMSGLHVAIGWYAAQGIAVSSSDVRRPEELLRRISCHIEETSECVRRFDIAQMDVEVR